MPAASPGAPPGASVDTSGRGEALTSPSEEDAGPRRSVVPSVAARSLWLAAAWTGAGAALFAAVASIVVVAICWLPASGASGNASSTVRAGVLTFLAALHAGVTIDDVPTDFIPLGMTMLVGLIAWRAGTGLADAVEALGERAPKRLTQVAAVQVLVFAAVCGVAARFATLGTSGVAVLAATVSAAVLFAVTGGAGFVLASPLRDLVAALLPSWLGRVARAAVLALACYLALGAALVAGALVVRHSAVQGLSREVGGGWSGIPILVLGVLSAPNAVIAAMSYLAGPGFALGTGTHVSLVTQAHGTLPAFPLLGAMPIGHGANWPVWIVAAAAPVLAGVGVARVVARSPGWWLRVRDVGLVALFAAVFALVLAWQGGGAIGSGRLNAVGASPWRLAAAVGIELLVLSAVALGVAAAATRLARWRRARRGPDAVVADAELDDDGAPGRLRSLLTVVGAAIAPVKGDVDDDIDDDIDVETADEADDETDEATAVALTEQLVDPDGDTRQLPHVERDTNREPGELAG